MAAQPSSSKDSSAIEKEFRNNVSNIESARFLKRVLQKAEEEEGKLTTHLADPTERVYNYTGLDKRIFPILRTNVEITELHEVDRSLIHAHLIAFYLNESLVIGLQYRPSLIPTTKNLFKSLYGKISPYLDIRTFRKYLANMGYVWLRIAKGYIVMERPSVTFERYYYLKDIVRYREENREIFYVDETVLTSDYSFYSIKKYKSLMKAAAKGGIEVSQKGLIKSIYAVSRTGIHALKTIDDFTASNFENWIVNELLPVLPEKSVVVIKTMEHHDDIIKRPTLYSIKSDMKDWLERNNVPFDENMSKCELITLIDTYTTDVDEVSKIATTTKLRGHELLRLPFTIDDVTPAQHLFELIKLNASKLDVNHTEVLVRLCETISSATLEEYDEHVARSEREILQNDIKVDKVLDDVIKELLNVRLRDPEDSEVPFSESD